MSDTLLREVWMEGFMAGYDRSNLEYKYLPRRLAWLVSGYASEAEENIARPIVAKWMAATHKERKKIGRRFE